MSLRLLQHGTIIKPIFKIRILNGDIMKKEIIAEYTYELPEPTDEEIKEFFQAEGITDVNTEEVRQYIRESLYKLFCELASKNNK